MMFEILQVVWNTITDATVASLVGPLDAAAKDVVTGVLRVAEEVPRLLVDLDRVSSIDAAGVVLLESLRQRPNVGIVNPSEAVQQELERLGRFGL